MIPHSSFFASSPFHDDGLIATAAESWFKVKIQLIQQYFQSFITHASGRVDEIVFVDLFAGSGAYSVGSRKEFFEATCLASLHQELPVSKWIFCESSSESANALKIRVNKYFRGKNVLIFESKPDQIIDKLQLYIPPSKGGHKTAVFCVVDPFSIDIPFTVLDKLHDLGFSFLVPYTFGLTDRHNYSYYLSDQKEKFKKYMGGFRDLDKFEGVTNNAEFYKRLVRIQQNNMLMLGLNASLSVHKLDSQLMDTGMYYIGFFSKQLSSRNIQKEVLAGVHHQLPLF